MNSLVSRPDRFRRILEGLRNGEYVLFVKFIDGEEFSAGKYHIPVDIDLMTALEDHLRSKERAYRRLGVGPIVGIDLSQDSGPIKIHRLINPGRRELSVNIELPQDRIYYSQPQPSAYSKQLQRAIEVHNEYWAEGSLGVKSEYLRQLLINEGFTPTAAKRIDRIVRPEKQ